ncbi:MAG: PD40 domain-containing protein [Deltaproteobacteria bacterium]|nr:PD40 domain-containing protein [Deltaproteobacteria bacterium]
MGKSISVVAILFTTVIHAHAQAGQVYIPVGEARVKKSVVAFPNTKYMSAGMDSGDPRGLANTIKELIINDLNYTNLFSMQSSSAFIEKPEAGLTLESFRISDWSTIGTEFLIKTGISITGDNIAFEMRLYDVLGTKQVLGKRYVAKTNEPRVLAHTVGNDLMLALTGKPGIFFTKITMVCNKSHEKEIWVMDFDGTNPHQLTSHRTLSFAPAWGTDNRHIAYSLYTKNSHNVKNIDLYEYDFATRHSRLLSNRHGINSGAAYSPNGHHIALTMSFLGNPDIFLLDPATREVTRLTRSLGTDVDPAWAPDGKRIAFISTRSNQPMVYVGEVESMKTSPGAATRLTFAGKLNATPSWSPMGNKIAFASLNDAHFDLFMMSVDGTNLERLTKNEGNNEDPHFSPDGNFLVFSSNRTGQKNVYVISADGQNTKRLTWGLGECEAPKWSTASSTPF